MSSNGTIGIVGAGPFGTALASVLGKQGKEVLIWSRSDSVVEEINTHRANRARFEGPIPESVSATGEPARLGERARFILIAVAATDVRDRLRMLGDHLDGSHLLVHALGALSVPDDALVTDVIREETPVLRVGVVAGPALPAHLMRGQTASLVCASEFDEVTAAARRLLSAPPFLRLYRASDLVGVELAAALSSAYTIALGVADALEVGIGTRAVLLTRAIAEMSRIGVAAGGQSRTFSGLAGLGNLLVRASAEGAAISPSYRLGAYLGRGEEAQQERLPAGAHAAVAGLRLARRLGQRAPILEGIVSVVDGSTTARTAAEAILAHVAEEE